MSPISPVLKIAFDPIYAHPLPEGHRFPMLKYELIPEQLLYEGTIADHNLFAPAPCADEVVLWVDILSTDKFGKLKISLEGCRQRDAMVFSQLKQQGIPCVVAMGGGYSPDIKTIVEAHCNTFRVAKDVYGL